jgi:hypothetical protein
LWISLESYTCQTPGGGVGFVQEGSKHRWRDFPSRRPDSFVSADSSDSEIIGAKAALQARYDEANEQRRAANQPSVDAIVIA